MTELGRVRFGVDKVRGNGLEGGELKSIWGRFSRRGWVVVSFTRAQAVRRNGIGGQNVGMIQISGGKHDRGVSRQEGVRKIEADGVREESGGGNESAKTVVAGSPKGGTVVVEGSIEVFLSASKRELPIKDGGIPVDVASHDHMGVGSPLVVGVGTKIEVWQAVANMERELKTVGSGDELAKGVKVPSAVIDKVQVGFELGRGDDRRAAHHASKLVEDGDDGAMVAGDSVGATGDDGNVDELVSVNTLHVDKPIS
jgi:hypothetical protein